MTHIGPTTPLTKIALEPLLSNVYGKPCHLPVEVKDRAYWASEQLKFDLKTLGESRMAEFNELEELRLDTYESSSMYKERMNKWHEKAILKREFKEGDLLLLFNSYLKLFHRKLHSRWYMISPQAHSGVVAF